MTGLVGAVTQGDVRPMLAEGLRRLEFMRYDSAGFALLHSGAGTLDVARHVGRVHELEQQLGDHAQADAGIAHTRRATRGVAEERNAHPQVSHADIAVVHNGELTNDRVIRAMLEAKGYLFDSETDTEVIAHLIHDFHKKERWLLKAVREAVTLIDGRYAIAVVAASEPECLVVARHGSPLVIGIGAEGQCVASDTAALLPWTRRCIFLEEGDVAELRRDDLTIVDRRGHLVVRSVRTLDPLGGTRPAR